VEEGEAMDKIVKQYYQLKQQQKEIEQQLAELRGEIINHCSEQSVSSLEVGNYRVKLVQQERKEYDDQKLYEALPDPEVWRMLSKADPSKVTSLIKLNVISEESIKGTFSLKHITLLQVDKK
jgi:cell division septum initiation protein DivIVA